MDIYHIWCDLKPGVSDLEFCARVSVYMTHLKDGGKISNFRITRRKLGLGPAEMAEFHITLETENLAQLDEAFQHVASRSGEVESFHHAVNSQVSSVKFALYRDFPDAVRKTGEEKF
ncbi:MAG: hypothetical protein HN644_01610 [Rhodospirillales bacterium]|jgi:hypothetical protein|nr:hypothetical protein [Rhodospirillales bacterium]MBT4040638.1 hypothetical protein [Rhodospirillales bacterium]MBT4626321.1 hypothetical protein [Rhodospirillales bacterium]MBT5350225.1 hypothetical protein [Rhodospirillales bacterium]MBT5520832.1 hypothetical protein [Rhodospirillales bacterium]